MNLLFLITKISFWILVSSIPLLLFLMFNETENMMECRLSDDCINIDDRTLVLPLLFYYAALLLWPLSLIKIALNIHNAYKQRKYNP